MKRLLLTLTLLPLALVAQAQTVEVPGLGSLVATASTITYDVPGHRATVSRDRLDPAPMWTEETIRLLVSRAGETAFEPAADTTVFALLDQLGARLDSLQAVSAAAATTSDSLASVLAAERAALADERARANRLRNERDAARADAQALTDIIDRIARRVAELLNQ